MKPNLDHDLHCSHILAFMAVPKRGSYFVHHSGPSYLKLHCLTFAFKADFFCSSCFCALSISLRT